VAVVEALIVAACTKVAKKLAGDVVTLVGSQSPAEIMARQLGEAYDQTLRDTGLSAYNGVRALLAVALMRDPSAPEILGLMDEAGKSQGFAARAVRLVEAARRSPTDRRRQMLASVLYGLPFTDATEVERDRVDMMVERLMPQDVDLLNRISGLWKSLSPKDPNPHCLALNWSGLRMIRYPLPDSGHLTVQLVEETPIESGAAFATLQSAGCIEVPGGYSTDEIIINGAGVHSAMVEVTPLGRLLLEALGDVCTEIRPE
jgi:hypothetical protein